MVDRRRGSGGGVHGSRSAVAVWAALGLVMVAVQPGDARVVTGQIGIETVDVGVYFVQVGDDLGAFGASVVMSGDGGRVAFGSSEAVRVLEWDGERWSQLGADFDVDLAQIALSADGRRLVIGEPVARNRVRVFEWDGAQWSQVGAALVGESAEDRFGSSVAISAGGSRMVIGAPSGSWGDPGYGRVYEWDGARWREMGADLVGAPWTSLGWSVAMSAAGDRVAISEVPAWHLSRHARVFEWDGAGWSQVGGDVAAAGDDLALSASGDRLAVGTEGDWEQGEPGRVSVFDLTGGGWALVDYSDSFRGESTGQSVALSADGRRLAYSGISSPALGAPTILRDERGSGWVTVGVGPAPFASYGVSVALSGDGGRLATNGGVFDISATPPVPLASPVALVPARLLDSRVGGETVDGISARIGRRSAGSVTELAVAGRGGVPSHALAVMMDVVAVRPEAIGFVTVFPCGTPVPLASNLNYTAGQVIANSVFTGIGIGGRVCVYTSAATELVVDVTGYTPVRAGLRAVAPTRFMDTRTGSVVTGYDWETGVAKIDRLAGGSVTEFWVSGRFPVPFTASAVMLDVVTVRSEADGYLTVFPCRTPVPSASNLNYTAGQVIANSAFTRIGIYGTVCVYTSATTDVVVDVTGYTPAEDGLWSPLPARLLDSRAGGETVDEVSAGIGRRSAGSVTAVVVAGRGGVPVDASAVVLNVVAVRPDAAGYLTVYPCATPRPLASNLNYAAGQVIANSVFAGVGAAGTVCVYTYASTELVVDVTGHT